MWGMDRWIDRYIPSHFGEGSKLMQLLLTDFEGMIPQCILWVDIITDPLMDPLSITEINRQKMVVERRRSFWGRLILQELSLLFERIINKTPLDLFFHQLKGS